MSPSRPGRSTGTPTVEETSAGGLLIDFDRDPLSAVIIGRYDRRGRMVWSLPKGHIEEGETREQTAIREIAEETGIEGEVLCELGTIDFTFVAEGRRIHKTVHHFLLERTGGEVSTEDVEGGRRRLGGTGRRERPADLCRRAPAHGQGPPAAG